MAWVSWVALPSAGTGNFLGNSGFFANVKQVHVKVFCSSSFLMCPRNSVIFRLPVEENFPYQCMDDSGE